MALRVGAIVALVLALVLMGRFVGRFVPAFTERIDALGVWAPAVFIAGYAIACVAFVPGSLLTLAAGAIFGLVKGTVVVLAGATIGAAAAFLVARYLARGAVERQLAGNAAFSAIDRAVGVDGLRIVALLRLSPVFPFNLLNYALGLTRVRFADYLLASVAMLPGTVLYVYYGKVAGDVAALAGGAGVHRNGAYYALLGLGLLAALAVTVIVARLARRALEEATGPDAQTREMPVPVAPGGGRAADG